MMNNHQVLDSKIRNEVHNASYPAHYSKKEKTTQCKFYGVDRHDLKCYLMHKYSDVFDETLSHTTLTTHKINTGTSPPIKQAPGRLPYAHRDEAQRQINDMLKQGVIRPSTSAWSSPVILVKKERRTSVLRRLSQTKFSYCWSCAPIATY